MFYSVQYMRALASFLVLLYHVSYKASTNDVVFIPNLNVGYFGVDLFFILSGFIMCISTENKDNNFFKFLFGRVVKIIPLYWILSLFALMIYIYRPDLINSSGGETSVIGSFFLIPTTDKYLIQNGWTLSFEFLFYFIFALFFYFNKFRLLGTSLFILFIFFLGTLDLFVSSEPLYVITHPVILEFVFGIFAYYLYRNGHLVPKVSYITLPLSLLLMIVVNQLGGIDSAMGRSLYAGIPMFMLFIGLISLESRLIKLKPLLLCGNSSYSLYLIHPFILSGVTLIYRLMGVKVGDYPNSYVFSMIFLSLLFSIVCYRIIEVPMGSWIKNKLRY